MLQARAKTARIRAPRNSPRRSNFRASAPAPDGAPGGFESFAVQAICLQGAPDRCDQIAPHRRPRLASVKRATRAGPPRGETTKVLAVRTAAASRAAASIRVLAVSGLAGAVAAAASAYALPSRSAVGADDLAPARAIAITVAVIGARCDGAADDRARRQTANHRGRAPSPATTPTPTATPAPTAAAPTPTAAPPDLIDLRGSNRLLQRRSGKGQSGGRAQGEREHRDAGKSGD